MQKFFKTIILALIISFFSVLIANGLNDFYLSDNNVEADNTAEREKDSKTEVTSTDINSNEKVLLEVLDTISNDNAYFFYYEQFDDDGKKVYDLLLDAILSKSGNFEKCRLENGEIKGEILDFKITEDVIGYEKSTGDFLGKVYTAIRYDHRELFYLDSMYVTEIDENNKCVSLKVYCADEYREESVRNQIFDELKEVYDEVLNQVKGKSEYEKIDYIVNYVIKQVDYCSVCKNGGYHEYCHNIHGLLEKESVCEGYAATIDWLAKGAEVNQIYIIGDTADGGEHAWNYVKLNDKYYLLDTTWSDAGKFSDYLYSYIGSEGFGQKYISSVEWNYPELSATSYYEDVIAFDKSEAYYEEYLYNLINTSVNKINMSQENYELQENGMYVAECIITVDKLPYEISTVEFCKEVFFRYCNENSSNVRFLIDGFVSLDDGDYCKNILLCLKEEYSKAENRK